MSAWGPLTRRSFLTGAGAAVVVSGLPVSGLVRRASGQDFVMEPIVVQALGPQVQPFITGGIQGTPYGVQFGQILQFLMEGERYKDANAFAAAKAAAEQVAQTGSFDPMPLINIMEIPPTEPTQPNILAPPELALWGGAEADYIREQFEQRGFGWASSITATVALGAAARLATGGKYIVKDALKFIAEGMKANTIGMRIVLVSGGYAAFFVGTGMVVGLSILAAYIVVYEVLPAIGQQITVFGEQLFAYDAGAQPVPQPLRDGDVVEVNEGDAILMYLYDASRDEWIYIGNKDTNVQIFQNAWNLGVSVR